MKNLYSISGLLPAQFRTDQASTGVGWTTINPIIVESENSIEPIKTCDESAIKERRDDINVGDFVQVNSDYDNSCEDELVPGGIYMVAKVDRFRSVELDPGTSFKLSYSRFKSWINGEFIRKIDFEVGARVRSIGAVVPPGLDEDECEKVSGPGVVTEIRLTKDGRIFSYAVHLDEIDDFWWFGEGQFTLDN